MDRFLGWLGGHPAIEFALSAAMLAVVLTVLLASICGIVYFSLFLWRLRKPTHVAEFLKRSIPSVQGGKLLGQEFALQAQDEIRQTGEVLDDITRRQEILERIVSSLYEQQTESPPE